jgi:hypothetical protein
VTTIDYWDAEKDAGTVVTFASDYRYRIANVDECSGFDCTADGECVAMLDLQNVDFPRLWIESVHVGAARDVSTIGEAKA